LRGSVNRQYDHLDGGILKRRPAPRFRPPGPVRSGRRAGTRRDALKSPSVTARDASTARVLSRQDPRAGTVHEPGVVLGRYRVKRRLGAGSFGVVWLAHDERLERDVAVKIVPRERIVGARFDREARAAARLAHPGIVVLYEAAIDDDGAYLVSELVRGPTLAERLAAGHLSDRDVVAIAIALCDALAHAHAQGVVHRDLTPANVLVPDDPATLSQLAKLTDFGIARLVGGDSLTRTGDVVGTAAYMAPEQAEGREAGPAADLYGLALIVYECLTGVNPVAARSGQRPRRLGTYLPPLRRQRRDLPGELAHGIDLALRPRPGERGTIGDLRAALEASLHLMRDRPGVVVGALARGTETQARTAGSRTSRTVREPRRAAPAPAHGAPAVSPSSTAWPWRALAALAAAATCAWLLVHVFAPSPVAPFAAATLAGLLVLAFPRIGWLALILAVAGVALADHQPGTALVLAFAALVPGW
jgi:hypothetical protein